MVDYLTVVVAFVVNIFIIVENTINVEAAGRRLQEEEGWWPEAAAEAAGRRLAERAGGSSDDGAASTNQSSTDGCDAERPWRCNEVNFFLIRKVLGALVVLTCFVTMIYRAVDISQARRVPGHSTMSLHGKPSACLGPARAWPGLGSWRATA